MQTSFSCVSSAIASYGRVPVLSLSCKLIVVSAGVCSLLFHDPEEKRPGAKKNVNMNSSLAKVIVCLMKNKRGFHGAFTRAVPICGPSALGSTEVSRCIR